MPKTIVHCSFSGCKADADAKVAAPWKGGSFSELKTYGYACTTHTNDVIAYAEKRPRPNHLDPAESIGAVKLYELSAPG